MPLISVVVPCYNEEGSIPLFLDEVEDAFARMRAEFDSPQDPLAFEVVYVDDGSTDSSLEMMRMCARERENDGVSIRYVSFSRNFGKDAALLAGLDAAKGDYVATMDVDLQDPPALLPVMYRMLQEGDADDIAACRVSRKGEPAIRSWAARVFYRLIRRLSDMDIRDGARDYRLMKRGMVDAICSMREANRFSKGIFSWVGFKTEWLEYENVERNEGETKWSFFSLCAYALDGITAFSTKPLQLASIGGVVFCLLAFVMFLFIVIRTLLFGDPVPGWPSLTCLLLFVSGIQMMCMGIFGQYLAKSYAETKKRPVYIVKERG